MLTGASDADVIAASLEDGELFAEVLVRHRSAVFGFITRQMPRDDAADLTSEVFAKAFSLRAAYDTSRSSALPWLLGIAHNVVGDHYRRREVRVRHQSSLLAIEEVEDDPYLDVVNRLAIEKQREHIVEALSRLEPRDRDVLILTALGDMTYAEVAETLNIPIGTVKSRLSRARSRMRLFLPGGIESLVYV
jgi:RNA polymerase sigma factor (sigma-70 family)